MKNMRFLMLALPCFFIVSALQGQNAEEEKLNLPGDNLNLYAVLNLFQDSETLEAFEKNLNAEDSKINNLDLNGDDQIDYIKVIDQVDNEDHTIVMQVAINDKENQDVAVITVFKDQNKQIQMQLIGDEDLYGKNYIVEPKYPDSGAKGETPNPGYSTNTTTTEGKTIIVEKTVYVEVQTWPVITYMYAPSYVRWNSPWYWGYYPSYWNPWRPYYWDYYYGYHYHWHSSYYGHYHRGYSYRTPMYSNNYYNGRRSNSQTVKNYKATGKYTATYSRPDTRKDGSAEFTKKYTNGTVPAKDSGKNSSEAKPELNKPSETSIPKNDKTDLGKPQAEKTTPEVKKPSSQVNKGGSTKKPAKKPSVKPAVSPRPAPKPAPRPAPRPAPKPKPTQGLH